jgi:hypothetical protein
MLLQWFRQDKEAVLDALRRREPPLMATTMNCGSLDELVALHFDLGVFEALVRRLANRLREGVGDPLLVRTLATLPFLQEPALDSATRLLFQEPAILLRLGWTAAQIQSGANHRRRHSEAKQPESLPGHPVTLRDAFRRVKTSVWIEAQKTAVRPLFERQLVYRESGK